MNRGARRLPVFGDDDDRSFFLRCIDEARSRTSAGVHGFALMGNHYHLLVQADASTLSATMKYIGENYTRRFNVKYGLDGSLFRGRFLSKPVTDDRYLLTVLRYIHRNCLDLGEAVAGYDWSSHRAYAGLSSCPKFLQVGTLLSQFESRQSYREFVETGSVEITADDPADISSVRVGSIEAVERALGIDSVSELDLLRSGHEVRSDLRMAAALLAQEHTHHPSGALAKRYGYSSGGSLRCATSRARQRIVTDSAFRATVDDARARLAPPKAS